MIDLDGWLCNEICWTDIEARQATPNYKHIAYFNDRFHDSITIIYTARNLHTMGQATLDWLDKHGIKYWGINFNKLPADKYYDDNAENSL
jgi:hypothetical protein